MQELVCATDAVVHCGHRSVGWPTVVRLQELLSGRYGESSHPTTDNTRTHVRRFEFCQVVISVIKNKFDRSQAENLEMRDKAVPLLCLLLDMDGYQATNPKDMIYSLLGIVEDINLQQGAFPIDYSLSDEQVYVDVAKYIIVTSRILDLNILSLCRPRQSKNSKYNLPSWCPDWTLDYDTNMLLKSSIKNGCTTASTTLATVSFGPHVRAMKVSGMVIDTIKIINGPFDWEKIYWYQFLALTKGSNPISIRLVRNYS
jgi:hypothetical protein